MTIDAVYYNYVNSDFHRYRQIEGYCENNPAGDVRVNFHFGNVPVTVWQMLTHAGTPYVK